MSAHLSQVFAGLYELQACGLAELQFATRADWPHLEHLLCAEVASTQGGTTRRVCFDMSDSRGIDCAALDHANVYFKRTYVSAEINKLPERLRARVRPYGLNYGCSSDKQLRSFTFARQLYTYELADERQRASQLNALRRRIGHSARWLGARTSELSAGSPLPFCDFEEEADSVAKPAVLFLTRLWRPAELRNAEKRQRLNDTRIAVVRTLRDRLGDRFLGGVEHDRFAEEQCPDCIVDRITAKTHYIGLMKTHLIGVATTGLHDSTGWKIAEYVAASRCIVTEPLQAELPAPLVEGENYFSFRTPQECARACERILDDPALARKMRLHNQHYYRKELKPPVMMLKRLKTAMAAER